MDFGPDFLIYWAIGAAVVGLIASSRGKGFLGFFLLSVLLSPIIGLLIALFSGDGQKRAPCWQCKESVVVGALKCAHCGAELVWPKATPG
jgi:hypothetical protein